MDMQVISDWACVVLGGAGVIGLAWAFATGQFRGARSGWKPVAGHAQLPAGSGALTRSQKVVIGAIFFLVGLTGFGSVITVFVAMARK